MDTESSAGGRACHCAEFIRTSQKIGHLLIIKIKTLYFYQEVEYLPAIMGFDGIFIRDWLLGLLAALPDSVGVALMAAMVWSRTVWWIHALVGQLPPTAHRTVSFRQLLISRCCNLSSSVCSVP